MILPIVLYGSKILRNKAYDIDAGDNFTELAANMTLTLKKTTGIWTCRPSGCSFKKYFCH